MTEEQLDAIRARCEAASPGPWVADLSEWCCLECTVEESNSCEESPDSCGEGVCIRGAFIDTRAMIEDDDYCWYTDSDAKFIAHAREDIPALLADREYWKERAEALESALEGYDG